MTGIRIEPAGEDEYFGFELDGDGLFLLEDMTVTHNSTLTRQVALQVAMRGLPTALFSLETGREEHLACIPHLLTRVDEKLTYTMGEYQLLTGARDRMRDIPFYIDDTSPLSVSVLKTKLVQLRAREPGLAMIFVDYLQLMEGAKQREENLDVTPITRGLKQLAMNTGLPIVALSAMNRGIETRGPDAEPMLSDLRWGGEADADIVVFVRRVRQSAVEGMRGARNRAMPARIFIKKNRNGPVDDRFDLTFLAAQKRFEENVNDIA
jgi:replicative DNA helicase